MKKNILYSCLCSLLFVGCNSFLDEQPSKTTSLEISTVEHLDALLGSFSRLLEEPNRTAIYSTDDFGLTKEVYDETGTSFSLTAAQYAFWDKDNLPLDDREGFWSGEYSKIFIANLVLSNLGNVSGDARKKEELRCEAHLVRAYSYFELVNTFALPYMEKYKDEPGVTLKLTNSFEEEVGRQPLEKVYAQIESDLKEALKAPNQVFKDGVYRPWRGNSSAARAFAARYYLQRNNYSLALDYAGQALTEYGTLVDYNTEMDYSDQVYTYPVENSNETIKVYMPKTWSDGDGNYIHWKEFYYARVLYHESGWYVPSRDLLKLYDEKTDLRYKYHMVEDFSKYKNRNYPSMIGYVFYGTYYVPAGPTVAEMILIKAECQARQGQWEDAMNTLSLLRSKRIVSTQEVALTAVSQSDAIRKILEERRREMPFAMRWLDLRRLNNNETPEDDVVMTKEFYPLSATDIQTGDAPITYSLPVNSRRWACPLPYDEIYSSNGAISQNIY